MDTNNPIIQWFGNDFSKLHPLIQDLHNKGGHLTGPVKISLGKGIAGVIGKRLALKLGIPTEQEFVELKVLIGHTDSSLIWNRTFNDSQEMKSTFVPNGVYPQGYWVENTGNIDLKLTVQIIDGGWHWIQQGIKFRGISLPLWLIPKTTAYKQILNEKYVFSVSFSYPLLGELLSYSGELILD